MVKFTVDGPARLLIAKAGITAVDVKIDLYSDAKEDWAATESLMRFPFPFRTVGGDPIGGGKFFGDGYFLTNGWKIRPQEASHELTVTGNLFLDSTEVGGIFVPTLGAFTVLATVERSADAIGINSTAISAQLAAIAADAGNARKTLENRAEIDFVLQQEISYEDDGVTPRRRWPLETNAAEPVATAAGIQTKRKKSTI